VIRGYRETDEPQIGALLVAAWPEDPVLVEVSALHGPDLDENERLRRTLVAEEAGSLIGAATLLGTPRHQTFLFFTAVVAPERRARGSRRPSSTSWNELGTSVRSSPASARPTTVQSPSCARRGSVSGCGVAA
jgi:hypothetical protein